jgi:hypothetical protein
MRKIYRLDSDYLTEEVNEIISKIPKVTKETITKFVDYLDLIEEICIKEDGTYGKDEGKEIMIVVLYEWEKEKMRTGKHNKEEADQKADYEKNRDEHRNKH